jgi:hypothetical protein
MRSVLWGILVGALVGGVLGLLVGLAVHAIFSSDSSLVGYEVVAGLLGAVFGVGLGAFYGGALRLPRDRGPR